MPRDIIRLLTQKLPLHSALEHCPVFWLAFLQVEHLGERWRDRMHYGQAGPSLLVLVMLGFVTETSHVLSS